MSKQFFLIYQKLNLLPPKLFRTLKTVQKYKMLNNKYQVLSYDDQFSAKNALTIKQIQFSKYRQSLKNKSKQNEVITSKNDKQNLDNISDNQSLISKQILKNTQLKNINEMINNNKNNPIRKTLQELQSEKNKLLSLTAQMPKLLHYHSVTQVDQQIYPQTLYTGYYDGCTKFNPGPSGAGYYIKTQNKLYLQAAWPLGTKTNNQAQFLAFLYLMVDAYINGIRRMSIFGDNKLSICVGKGQMIATSPNIIHYADACKKIIKKFDFMKLQHVSRIYNTHADKLSNQAVKKKFQKPNAPNVY